MMEVFHENFKSLDREQEGILDKAAWSAVREDVSEGRE